MVVSQRYSNLESILEEKNRGEDSNYKVTEKVQNPNHLQIISDFMELAKQYSNFKNIFSKEYKKETLYQKFLDKISENNLDSGIDK